jgi:hypothetical protein
MPPQNPYAPPKAAVADVVSTEADPPLWNPNAAASWSLLFSPIFGAFLHMRNWEALGQLEKAATSKIWVIGNIVFYILVAVAAVVLPDSKGLDALGRIGGIGLLLAWYYGIGKSQQVFVVGRFGTSYPRRGWLKPILVAIGVLFAFIVVVSLLFMTGAESRAA